MMSKDNENLHVIQELSEAVRELNPDRVAFIFKWQIIDLRDKAIVLLESVSRLENSEKEVAISAAREFLAYVEAAIKMIKTGEYK